MVPLFSYTKKEEDLPKKKHVEINEQPSYFNESDDNNTNSIYTKFDKKKIRNNKTIVDERVKGLPNLPVLQSETKDRRQLYPRAELLWNAVEPEQVARLLGVHLCGLTGERAKEMLREKKVWPFYYPTPNDTRDFDRYPADLRLGKQQTKSTPTKQKKASKHGKKISDMMKKMKRKLSRKR